MNYWLMLGEASARICVPWSLCRLYLSLVPSPAATTSFASSKFWSHYWGCHLQSLASGQEKHSTVLVRVTWLQVKQWGTRADSTSPARVEHELNTSPSFSQLSSPWLLLSERLEPKGTKMQTLSSSRMQQLPLFESSPWESSLAWHISSIPWKMRGFHIVTPIADLKLLHWPRPVHCRHLSKLSLCGLLLETSYRTHSSYGRNRSIKKKLNKQKNLHNSSWSKLEPESFCFESKVSALVLLNEFGPNSQHHKGTHPK